MIFYDLQSPFSWTNRLVGLAFYVPLMIGFSWIFLYDVMVENMRKCANVSKYLASNTKSNIGRSAPLQISIVISIHDS